jgi:hypothetical protein
MRIATLILGIVVMLIVSAQSCAVSFGGEVFEDQSAAEGGAVGIVMALLILIGAAFALVFPLVSLVTFGLAGLLGIAGGATTNFGDLSVWGWVSLILAVLSFFGWREKRKRRSADRVT